MNHTTALSLLFQFPLYVCVPNTCLGMKRHVRLDIALYGMGYEFVVAELFWQELDPAYPHGPCPQVPPFWPSSPEYDVLMPANPLNDPIYICVRKLGALSSSQPFAIVIRLREEGHGIVATVGLRLLPAGGHTRTGPWRVGIEQEDATAVRTTGNPSLPLPPAL
ncbi:hypothetical protein C8Q76DRAFT_791011 [Earliella scabrosa]|nr:hypothetical protein C8Q76DRAFT_791011 [Earliella scabrosa]